LTRGEGRVVVVVVLFQRSNSPWDSGEEEEEREKKREKEMEPEETTQHTNLWKEGGRQERQELRRRVEKGRNDARRHPLVPFDAHVRRPTGHPHRLCCRMNNGDELTPDLSTYLHMHLILPSEIHRLDRRGESAEMWGWTHFHYPHTLHTPRVESPLKRGGKRERKGL
jgi:hypothetical protein